MWTVLMNVNCKWWNKMRSIIVFNSCKGEAMTLTIDGKHVVSK